MNLHYTMQGVHAVYALPDDAKIDVIEHGEPRYVVVRDADGTELLIIPAGSFLGALPSE